MERKCRMCGVVFPPNTPATRKYCLDCSAIRYKENQARQKAKRKALDAVKAQERKKEEQKLPKTLSEADKRYCRKCVYAGAFTANYLCNFMVMTGERRGCKAGVGCERRLLEKDLPKDTRRACERCGTKFEGTKYRRFCDECRKELQREAGRRMIEKRRKNENYA